MVTYVGRAFAIVAVAVFAIATVGYAWAWSVDVAAETDDPYLTAKYANGGRNKAIGDYKLQQCIPGYDQAALADQCSDSVLLIKAKLRQGADTQRLTVLSEMAHCCAYMLAMFSVLCLKAHLVPTKQVDELEPIAFTCIALGFTLQVVEFALTAGPRGYLTSVGMEAMKVDSGDYSNFEPADWHNLNTMYETMNHLFKWFDVINYMLLSLGFATLSSVAGERASNIVDAHHVKVGYAIAVTMGLCFVLNILQEATSLLNFAIGYLDTLSKILIVTWFIMLGIGFGNEATKNGTGELLSAQ